MEKQSSGADHSDMNVSSSKAEERSRDKMIVDEGEDYSEYSTGEEEEEDAAEDVVPGGSFAHMGSESLEDLMETSRASTRCSVKYVVAAVSKFDDTKQKLVREIGFDGILELPQINKVDRAFTVWLLSKLDPDSRTIVVDGEEVVDMVDMDVRRILGIPCGSKPVTGLPDDDQKSRRKFMEEVLGAAPDEKNSLVAAGRIINKTYENGMTKSDCDHFKAAFVVFVVGHLIAPTTKNNVGNSSFWGALLNPDDIHKYNWGEYLIVNLVESARKVQLDLKTKQKVANITGCSIFLQVLYLDSIRVQGIDRARHLSPRIKAYTSELLRKMIEADQANSSGSSNKKTWGSNLKRSKALQSNSSADVDFAAVQTMSTFNFEIAKFIKDSFDAPLNQSQLDAIKVYGTRCTTHFEALKASIMKENLVLLEFLLSSTNTPRASTGRSIVAPADVQPRVGNKRSNDRIQNTQSRGYESADEGYALRRKSRPLMTRKNYSTPKTFTTPETILSGGYLHGHQESATAFLSRGTEPALDTNPGKSSTATIEKAHSIVGGQGGIDAPGFDLSFDEPQACLGANQPVNSGNMESSKEPQVKRAEPALSCNTTLGQINEGVEHQIVGTPMSAQRSSAENKWSTPDNRLGSSTVSPSSMSKIFAGCEIMGRVLLTEEEVNLNLKPYDDDVTESPVTKIAVDQYKLSRTPWFYGLKHSMCEKEKAIVVNEDLAKCNKDDLQRAWIAHRVPRYLEVSGQDLANTFSGTEPMSYDMFDLGLRRLVQLEDEMYVGYNDKRWRHILESDFSVLSQANENPCGIKPIRDQFFGTNIKYSIYRCRMIVVPVQVLKDWCCYFWDFKKKCIHVIDPFYKVEQSEFFHMKHKGIVAKIGQDIAKCIDLFFDKWEVEWDNWNTEYVVPSIQNIPCNESAFATLLSIKEFDGEAFRNFNKEAYDNFKMIWLSELLAMKDNQVKKIPMKLDVDKHAPNVVYDID